MGEKRNRYSCSYTNTDLTGCRRQRIRSAAEIVRKLNKSPKGSTIHVWWQGAEWLHPCSCPDTEMTGQRRQTIRMGIKTQKKAKERSERHSYLHLIWETKTKVPHSCPDSAISGHRKADNQIRRWLEEGWGKAWSADLFFLDGMNGDGRFPVPSQTQLCLTTWSR